ncbi:MAG: septation protein IspZ [Candidatus Azosocius agrarius]|nr:MAG: septation protein IspZ [Gammaproteobacteria bacterium]
MNNLLNISQLLFFFILFQYSNIYYAIITIIIINIINTILHYKIKKNNEYNKKFYIIIILITLGSLTIILQNELFIKWKLTIIYTIIGLILITNTKNQNKLILKNIGNHIIKLPQEVWITLNYIWGIFFIIIAIINIYISYTFNIKVWVYFKIFGITSLIVIFTFIQYIYIKYIHKK